MMRAFFFLCWLVGFAFACWATDQQQPPTLLSPTIQHAAYCAGVLDAVVPAPRKAESAPKKPWEKWWEKYDLAPAAFSAGDADNLKQRHDRYNRYLEREAASLVFSAPDTFGASIGFAQSIRQQGFEESLGSAVAFRDGRYAACKNSCATDTKCLVDCVDAYSFTAAKVLGCQVLKDGLPY
ncbi:MAG: hypothetical protein ABL907_14000 [Hyphomicrobium sp.]